MDVVVTGGLGFIGSHIVKKLIENGDKVTVIDNEHTGSLYNLRDVKDKFEFVKADAGDIINLGKKDAVFHVGIYSSTPMYRNDRTLMYKAIKDFVNILEYCVKNNAKLILSSSSSIYNGYQPPHKENMIPMVKDFYTEARYFMERSADLYHQMFGLKYIALRYFSVYGDGEETKKSYANMVSQFIWKGILNKPIKIYGDGSQRRDLIHVDDVVSANLKALESDKIGVFNVGNGKSYSFNEIISMVNKYVKQPIKVEYVKNPLKNYVDIVEADTNKMVKELGFKPSVNINEGIKRTFDYYNSLPIDKIPDID